MRDCVKRIVEKSDDKIKAKDARKLINMIDRQAKREQAAGADYDEAVAKILQERKDAVKVNLAKKQQELARNLILKRRIKDDVNTAIAAGLSPEDAIASITEGVNKRFEGSSLSLFAQKEALRSVYASKLVGSLEKEGLLELFNSKQLNHLIERDLWQLSTDGTTISNHKQASRIAQIVFDIMENQRQRMNNAGADIEKLQGYIMPQRHDNVSMAKDGRDAYANFMAERIDKDRSFDGDFDDPFDVMRGAYDAMITGVRLENPLQTEAAKLYQFSGPANLAKKLSRSRKIIFKDFESWKEWHEKYGLKDLNDGIMDALMYNASNIALMERAGVNPENVLKAAFDEAIREQRGNLKGKVNYDKVQTLINYALDKDKYTADPKISNIGGLIRAFNDVTMLGGATLSAISDIPIKTLAYKHQGRTWLQSQAQPFIDVAYGFKSKADRNRFSDAIGVYSESMIGAVTSRFSIDDPLRSKAAKLQRLYFKMNLLQPWTDGHKQSYMRTTANYLASYRGEGFDALPDEIKSTFSAYKIGKSEWDEIRKAAIKLDDGRYYAVSESIKNSVTAEKLTALYLNEASYAVIEPGARERRTLYGDSRPGTISGEVRRMVMQFKAFPVSIITKVWGRALYSKGKADIPAMIYLAMMSSVFGYIAMTAKDLAKGRTPKDVTKLETIFAAIAQGGGLGVLGDVLLQDAGFGRSLTNVLAGPSFGRLDDIFKIYAAGVRGEGSASTAIRTGMSYIPAANLPYIKPAIDNLFLYPMMEELNPGYLRRMDRNMQQTYGQERLFK